MSNLAQVLDTPLGVGQGGAAITPSDSTVVAFRAVYVGGTGNVVLTGLDGNDVTFQACPVGLIIPMACTKVKAATTATLLVGLK